MNSTINHPSVNESTNLSKVGENAQWNQQKPKQKRLRVFMNLVGSEKVKGRSEKKRLENAKQWQRIEMDLGSWTQNSKIFQG
jgi:hypothetical protein